MCSVGVGVILLYPAPRQRSFDAQDWESKRNIVQDEDEIQ